MTDSRNLKPRPLFRVVFFLAGAYFGWQAYAGRGSSPWGYFQYFMLYPGLCFFFCWYMALRGSAWWGVLPRWMMTGGAGRTDAGAPPSPRKTTNGTMGDALYDGVNRVQELSGAMGSTAGGRPSEPLG